ncbi:unnamed protein product [Phytophthora lilii]|uniref:Unnamed protein product n=1 Tax=Phytophthora lilii TaxID=2077276 RepID=A0A9W6TBS5_9STRA|nr:unnamed protein product [Phytophthora lilii]
MRARTRQGQISPEDLDKIAADFSKEVAQKVQDLGIKTVYNPDQTGWWDSYLSIQFLRFHFQNREDPSVPILLLWDDFSGHWTEEVIAYAASINVVLMKVPPSATAVCQPADVAWNKPLKQQLRVLGRASTRSAQAPEGWSSVQASTTGQGGYIELD